MLQANELRIGNKLKYGNNGPWREEFNGTEVTVDLEILGYISTGNKWYEPIPLTLELLEKYDFTFSTNSLVIWKMINNYSIELHLNKDGTFHFMVNTLQSVVVSTVHQLQNIVYALTGLEYLTKSV